MNEERSLMSPEGMMIMTVAVIGDLSAVVIALLSLIPYVGLVTPYLSVITAIFLTIFFALWGYFRKIDVAARKVQIEETAKTTRRVTKAAKRTKMVGKAAKSAKMVKWVKFLKWVRPFVGAISYLNLVPLWSISAYLEYKYSKG